MDNVSVVRLSPDQDYYAVNCTTDIDYDREVVYLNCPLTNGEISYYLAMLQNYISVYIKEQKQNYEIVSMNLT